MKSVLLTAALLVSLVSVAQAGQRFSFGSPITGGSYTNSMFSTASLSQGNGSVSASFLNLYGGNVNLNVDNFSSVGDYIGSSSVVAKYFVSKSTPFGNDTFFGSVTSGVYATGPGRITFVNPSDLSQTYLQVAFTKSGLSYPYNASGPSLYGSFVAAETLTFSGSLFDTSETGNMNAGFAFPDTFVSGSTSHHTGTFSASIGTIGAIQATPEPASFAAVAFGSFALLRRRRGA